VITRTNDRGGGSQWEKAGSEGAFFWEGAKSKKGCVTRERAVTGGRVMWGGNGATAAQGGRRLKQEPGENWDELGKRRVGSSGFSKKWSNYYKGIKTLECYKGREREKM